MSFQTVFSVFGVNQSDRDLIEAIALCQETGAHLSVLVVSLASPPPVGEVAAVIVEDWAAEREKDIRRLRIRGNKIAEVLGAAELSSDLSLRYCEIPQADEATGERARYADLTVIGPELLTDGVLSKNAVFGALFSSGRPVLIMPEGSKASLAPKRVVIGWNSGIEATRAVREALEMLAGAHSVSIAMVDPIADTDRNGPEPGADIATYLARHGAKITVHRLPSSGRSVDEVLRQHATDFAADMIVIGAYGHSRLRERIFGGTTRSMLANSELPLFMAR